MSDAYIVRRGGGAGGIDPANAVIHVTAQAGSTITFTKGGVLVGTLGPDKQHINAADSDKADWYYPVRPANFGEWDVTATLTGVGTGTYTVAVSEAKAYDVDVSLGYLIFRNGWQHGYEMSTITNVYDPQSTYTIDNDANPPRATTTRGNWGFALNNVIDVTLYNKLYVDMEIVYDTNYRGIIGLWLPTNQYARQFYDAQNGAGASVYYDHNEGFARDVYELDVSGLNGNFVFKAQQRDGSGSTSPRNLGIYLYDMYMT